MENELDFILNDIKDKSYNSLDTLNKRPPGIQDSVGMPSMPSGMEGSSGGFFDVFNKAQKNKINMVEYSDVSFDDVYARKSDGTYVAKYDSFLTSGGNQEEYHAKKQTSGEKVENGLLKAGATALSGIAGGTVGFVYGLMKGAAEGDFSVVNNNEFTKYLDELNEGLRYKLPNYYTQEEKNNNFLENAVSGNANFWANDVAGGAAFTVGAIASEAIWAYATGGGSLSTTFARQGIRASKYLSKADDVVRIADNVGDVAKVADKAEDLSEATRTINSAKNLAKKPLVEAGSTKFANVNLPTNLPTIMGKAGEFLHTARFTLTSAGYEAGMEKRMYINEMNDDFYRTFAEKNEGRLPTYEESQEFDKNLQKSASAVEAFNFAVVGASNLATIGRLFKIKAPSIVPDKWINSRLFGVGVKKAATGEFTSITANRAQKIAQNVWGFARSPIIEGVWEEGMQSVIKNSAKNWVQAGYDPARTKDTYGLGQATIDAFAETYGTKEGWDEIGIGMIIGLLSGTGVNLATGRGLAGEFKDEKVKADNLANYSRYYSPKKVSEAIMYANRVQNANDAQEQAEINGDFTSAELSRKEAVISQLNFGYNLDYFDESVKDTLIALDNIDDETISKQYQGDPQEIREQLKAEYKKTAEDYKRYRDFSEYFVGNSLKKEGLKDYEVSNVKQAIAYELTLGNEAYKFSSNILDTLKSKIASGYTDVELTNAMDVDNTLLTASRDVQAQFDAKVKEVKDTKQKKAALELEKDRLMKVLLDETQEQKVARVQQLNNVETELAQLDVQRQTLEKETSAILAAANLNNPFKTEPSQQYLTLEQIENLDENLNKVRDLSKSFRNADPQKALEIEKLREEYARSLAAFQRYADLARQLSDPKLGLRGKRNIIAELRSPKSPNEITVETLEGLLNTRERLQVENAERIFSENKEVEELIDDVKKGEDEVVKEEGATIEEETTEEKIAKLEEELKNLTQIPSSPDITIESLKDINKLTKEQRQQLKEAVRKQIELLKDDQVYFIHLTRREEDARSIIQNGLITGVAIESTTNITNSKEGLYEAISALIDGKIDHRDASNLVIIGFDKSVFEGVRPSADSLFDYLVENHPEFPANFTIPSEYNVGLFTNGKLEIVGNAINNNISSSTAQPNPRIKEIQDEIERLKKENNKEDEVVKKSPIEVIKDILKNNPYLISYKGYGLPKKLTAEEVDEYYNLASRAYETEVEGEIVLDSDVLSEEQKSRLNELHKMMSDWQLYSGAVNQEGVSITDIIQQQLDMNQEVPSEVFSEATSEELSEMSEQEPSIVENEKPRYEDIAQTYSRVFVRATKDYFSFHNISPSKFFSGLDIEDRVVVTIDDKSFEASVADLNNLPQDNTKLAVTFRDGSQGEFVVSGGGVIKTNSLNKVRENSNYKVDKYVSGKQSGYSLLYDGDTQVESDFSRIDGTLSYTDSELYNLSKDETINFEVNMEDPWNKAQMEIFRKDGDVVKLEGNLKIYIVDDSGNILGDVKSSRNVVGTSPGFLKLRAEAVKQALRSSSPRIQLKFQAPIKHLFLGVPNFSFDSEGNHTSYPIDPSTVVDFGYTEGGDIVLNNGTSVKVRKDLISKLLQRDGVPVVVFKQGEHYIAFPVNLKKTNKGLLSQVEDIINNTSKESDIPSKINQLLKDNNLSPKDYGLYYADASNQSLFEQDGNYSAGLQKAVDDLSKKENFMKPEDWKTAKDVADSAEININLSDKPLVSPKPIIDFDAMSEAVSDVYDRYQRGEELTEEEILDFANKGIISMQEAAERKEAIKERIQELDREISKSRERIIENSNRKAELNVVDGYEKIDEYSYRSSKGTVWIVPVNNKSFLDEDGNVVKFAVLTEEKLFNSWKRAYNKMVNDSAKSPSKAGEIKRAFEGKMKEFLFEESNKHLTKIEKATFNTEDAALAINFDENISSNEKNIIKYNKEIEDLEQDYLEVVPELSQKDATIVADSAVQKKIKEIIKNAKNEEAKNNFQKPC